MNNTFLFEVASDLYEKFGRENLLSDITIVAPSKRTRLFLNRYFSELSGGRPLWSPKYTNTARLFQEASGINLYEEQVQQISLIWELYLAYADVIKANNGNEKIESFDDFYFFGEILLHDFNDIDRELVSAEQIYRNISDLKQLESWEFLSREQKEIIRRFFNINPESKLQANFDKIWKILADVYRIFKEKLKQKNIAYEGMLMRETVENINADVFRSEKYVFVGFNRLSKAEHKLFKELKNKSLFYWDYDEYYLRSEAGKYIAEYKNEFPSALENADHKHFEKSKQIEIIEAVNAVSQVGHIPQWIKQSAGSYDFDSADSAIVLCDEKILPAVLSQIPAEIEPNIAILYSLMQSQVANLLLLLLELQIKGVRKGEFDFRYLRPVLMNSLIGNIYPAAAEDEENCRQTKRFLLAPCSDLEKVTKKGNETVKILTDNLIFKIATTPREILQYLISIIEKIGESKVITNTMEIAALSEASKMLNSIETIIPYLESRKVASNVASNVSIETIIPYREPREIMLKLIRRLLVSVKISCSGEPAKGLQIMAMSDTRNMDFRNLLVLSAGDGIMPKIEPDTSFIPPFLRRVFNLPTIAELDAQSAYSFYRLLGRAENITLMYSTGKNTTGKGEMSRYLLQLQWEESPHKIDVKSLETGIDNLNEIKNISVEKTPEMLDLLKKKYNGEYQGKNQKVLSPSAFNAYIDCPLQFYFRYVAGIKKPDDSTELDNAVLGTIFHKTMELIYKDVKKQIIGKEFFDKYLLNKDITDCTKNLIETAFEETYFKTPTKRASYSGEQQLYSKVIERMVRNTLIYDSSQTPFQIIDLEEPYSIEIELEDGTKIFTGGIIDRIDCKDNIVRVVDYKTGKAPDENKDYAAKMEDIFKEDRKKKAKYQFQTFLYSSILQKKGYGKVAPALIFPLVADDEGYNPVLKEVEGDFDVAFKAKLEELFDVQIPFKQCEKDDACKYCDYKGICGRITDE
jgi:hypothetical protein